MVGLKESRVIYVGVDEGVPQVLRQFYINIYMLRWLDDEMYPNDGIPQAVIKNGIVFE